jgi:hypothetical protein
MGTGVRQKKIKRYLTVAMITVITVFIWKLTVTQGATEINSLLLTSPKIH